MDSLEKSKYTVHSDLPGQEAARGGTIPPEICVTLSITFAQCGHHTVFPPSVASPGCRSVVVAGAVGGVAVRAGRAAVVATAVVTPAPIDAVAPFLPLPVPPTGSASASGR